MGGAAERAGAARGRLRGRAGGGSGAGGGARGRPRWNGPRHTGAHAPGVQSPEQVRPAGGGRDPPRRGVGVRSPARTRLLVLLVEFFKHLGRLPSAQTHRNLPRSRSRAEEAAGRRAPRSGAGWAAAASLGGKARPPRLSRPLGSPGAAATPSRLSPRPAGAGPGAGSGTAWRQLLRRVGSPRPTSQRPGSHARSGQNVALFG